MLVAFFLLIVLFWLYLSSVISSKDLPRVFGVQIVPITNEIKSNPIMNIPAALKPIVDKIVGKMIDQIPAEARTTKNITPCDPARYLVGNNSVAQSAYQACAPIPAEIPQIRTNNQKLVQLIPVNVKMSQEATPMAPPTK